MSVKCFRLIDLKMTSEVNKHVQFLRNYENNTLLLKLIIMQAISSFVLLPIKHNYVS